MTNASIEKELARHRFFSGLKQDHIAILAARAKERQVAADHILFRNDERAERFFLLRSGSVIIEIPAISGPSLEVQTLEPGQLIGWSWLIPPSTWSFQGRAVEDAELLEFDGKAILQQCDADPVFGYEILKRFSALMSNRLEAARERMIDEWNPPGYA